MGYTHYLYRPLEIDNFDKIVQYVESCYQTVQRMEIDIVGESGDPNSKPEFSSERIWFNGSEEQTPDGDGAHEPLLIDRIFKLQEWKKQDESGNYFTFCKTAGKPYDVLVMASYLITKYYDPRCTVASDGEKDDWEIAIEIAAQNMGIKAQDLYEVLEL